MDVARKFADHRGRLVLHATAPSVELDAVTTMLAETASEVKLFTDACGDSEASIRFAKAAAQAFGGLDARDAPVTCGVESAVRVAMVASVKGV